MKFKKVGHNDYILETNNQFVIEQMLKSGEYEEVKESKKKEKEEK